MSMNMTTLFPSALISGDGISSSLMLDDGSNIDQCSMTASHCGSFFLIQHQPYAALGGNAPSMSQICRDDV